MTSMYGRASSPQPGFLDQLFDPSSAVNAGALGLAGSLINYGQPSVGEKSFGGAFGAGVNGMLNGALAQQQAREEEKRLGLLNRLLEQQMGIADGASAAAGAPPAQMPPLTNMMPEPESAPSGPPVQTAQPMGMLNQPPMPVARPQTPMVTARPGMGVPGPRLGQPTEEERILLGLLNGPMMMGPAMQRGPF